MPLLRVNGIGLYYEEQGAGHPILCIHGGGSSIALWARAIAELGRRGRVIAYDRRGCGRSERPEPYERTTVAEQADDAAALLDAFGSESAVVIGRSYGGAVAVELALRRPQLVGALVLLEGDALGLSSEALDWTRGIRSRLQEVAADEGMDAVYPALIRELLGEGVWEQFRPSDRELLTRNGPALLAELDYVDQEMPDASAFATLDQPALVVAATESPPEQVEMTEAMARVLPNSRLVTVSGGHLIDPAAPEVLAFVDEHMERADAV